MKWEFGETYLERNTRLENLEKWHKWFAWYPVRINPNNTNTGQWNGEWFYQIRRVCKINSFLVFEQVARRGFPAYDGGYWWSYVPLEWIDKDQIKAP